MGGTGTVGPGTLRQIAHTIGVDSHGVPYAKVSLQSEQRLRVALQDVRPGELAHACSAVGLTVVSLRRVRLGRIPRAKLPPGQWRYLDRRERI